MPGEKLSCHHKTWHPDTTHSHRSQWENLCCVLAHAWLYQENHLTPGRQSVPFERLFDHRFFVTDNRLGPSGNRPPNIEEELPEMIEVGDFY